MSVLLSDEAVAAGDQMQSALSRIIAAVTTQTLDYETRMALHEGGSAIEAWSDGRRVTEGRAALEKAIADVIYREVCEPSSSYETELLWGYPGKPRYPLDKRAVADVTAEAVVTALFGEAA